MLPSVRVVAYEGGALRELSVESDSREAVLALPLSRLIVRMIRVPAERASDLVGYAAPILQAMSPYPDEELTVSCEVMRETSEGTLVLAAALLESSADDICEALDAKKLNITRVDALELGIVRGLWSSIAKDDARRILLVKGADGISLLVMDGDLPCSVRSLSNEEELAREVMLSLLEAEDFDGAKDLAEIVCVGDLGLDAIADLAEVRRVEVGADAGLAGVQERSNEPGVLNALPLSWKEVLEESRLKAKLVKGLSIAGGIWILIMAVLFGVPMVYGFMTDHMKGLSKDHQKKYIEVKDMRDKVKLVQKYSDHSRGALEVMKAVSDRLPGDIILSTWNFKREEGVRVAGEADTSESVWKLEDQMRALAPEGEGAEPVFKVVDMNGPTAIKGGRQKFDLNCKYEAEEE